MKKTFDSFYFLHVQKTGGRNYMYNFLTPIKDIMITSNIHWLNTQPYGSAHNQWLEQISDLTYVTCTFRDPCEQIISVYVHDESFKSDPSVSKEKFFNWFKDSQENKSAYYINYQSKNIVSPPIDEMGNSTIFNHNKITKEHVLNKISKMSLFIKPEILTKNNQKFIQNKILSDLGIKNAIVKNLEWKENEYRNSSSKDIYNSLTNKEKEYIRSINYIDAEIYETEHLFWKI
jgi:hypothetical protein